MGEFSSLCLGPGMFVLFALCFQGCENGVSTDNISKLKVNFPDTLQVELDSLVLILKKNPQDSGYIQRESRAVEKNENQIEIILNAELGNDFYLEVMGYSSGELVYHQARNIELDGKKLKIVEEFQLLEPENKVPSFQITAQPQDQYANKNQTVFFNIEIDSLEGAQFQWQKSKQNIQGADSSSLEYKNSGSEDNGVGFRAIVIRKGFKDTSVTAYLYVNEVPNLSVPLAEDDSLRILEEDSITFAASEFTQNDTDGDEDLLVLSQLFFTNNLKGQISGGNITLVSAEDFNGLDTLVYIVSDGKGGYDTANVYVTVEAVNDSPLLAPLDTLLVKENEELIFEISATDKEDDSLFYTLLEGPGTLKLDSLTGQVNWLPGLDDAGLQKITVEVRDNGNPVLKDSADFWINVANYNIPSIGFSVSSLSGTEKDSAGITLLLSQAASRQIYVSLKISGSATVGEDYSLSDSVFVFEEGETSKSLTIYVVDDDREEGLESIVLSFDSLFNVEKGAINQLNYSLEDDEKIPAGVIVVDGSISTDSGNGLSWASAFKSLSAALEAGWGNGASSNKPSQIWIAKGSYFPGESADDSYFLPGNVAIYGGFSGGESELSQRNFRENFSILSGMLPGGDTARHIALMGSPGEVILDGLQFKNAWARGSGSSSIESKNWRNNAGAGIYVSGSTAVIRNCLFANNTANSGAAIYVSDGDSVTVENSYFMENSGNNVFEGVSFAIVNSVFTNNLATAITIQESDLDWAYSNISHCVFYKNGDTDKNAPGAFDIYDNGSYSNYTTIINSIIWENGNILMEASQMMFRNGAQPSISNSVAFGQYTGAFKHMDEFSNVSWSQIISDNPKFLNPANPHGEDGVLFTADDGLNLASDSPAIDAIDGVLGDLEPEFDILGLPRVQGEGADMGAYEQ